jgi:hypothetical protein
MPPGPDAYRDELAAAQARIAELERVVAAQSASEAQARQITALLRERDRASAVPPRSILGVFIWMIVCVVAIGAAIACAVDHDWVVTILAIGAPGVLWLVDRRLAASNAAAAKRQVALIDERLAKMQRPNATEV